jgi:anaerobic magnesium-protoporphyrin IX monomethyl ester cyclase
LPGTKFYERVKQNLGEKHNWVDSEDLALMFAGTYVPDFYRTLHKVTHKKFRVWQAVATFRETLTRPWSLDPKILRRMAAGAFHLFTLPRHAVRLNALARK